MFLFIAQQLLFDRTTLVMFQLLSCFNSRHGLVAFVSSQLNSFIERVTLVMAYSLRLVMAYSLRLVTALSIEWPLSWPLSCQRYPPRPPWLCCLSPPVQQCCGLWPALPCVRSLQVQPGSNILQRRWVHWHTYNGFWILTAGALFKGVVRGLTASLGGQRGY